MGPDNRFKLWLPSLFVLAIFLVGIAAAQKEGASAWYAVVPIKRVAKPNREAPAHPLPKTQRAALLTIQWHLFERGDGNKMEQADASKTFATDDQLKLAITVNQPGYLYIINQPEGKDGVILFPDPRISKGQNYVLRNQEFVVPDSCYDPKDPQRFQDPKDCWFTMSPPAGLETMLVVFSRQKITTLPNVALKPFGVVKRSAVEELIASSQQKVSEISGDLKIPGREPVPFATRVQNTNDKDNEELIATIKLKHGD